MGLSKARKNYQRVKWYQCFRPENREDRYPVPFYENGGKENNRDLMRNTILVALSDDENVSGFSGSFPAVGDERRCRKSRSRRGLSRAFKAVMSPIVSVKKGRSKKFDQEKPQFRSNSSSISSSIEKMLHSFGSKNSSASAAAKISKDNPLSDSQRSDSSAGSLFSGTTTAAPSAATSRTSSLASNSRSASARKRSIAVDLKQLEKKQNPAAFHRRCNAGGCCKTMLGLYFLFVCLLALTLCGKALAVFCTSSSLFLLPCCLKKMAGAGDYLRRQWCRFVYSSIDPVDCVVVVDCDKKVIGVLETQRSRNGRLQE